jgi:nitroimidazol reductase NimA-like FMN-containing flavoprotein (pyridoxamine 5'-phosphate oxidase superfamily)
MMLRDDHSQLEVLDRDTCHRLLRASELGRLAVCVGASPEIFPVNYRLDGETILIRTAPGTKLRAIGRTQACFEIDGADRVQHTGWSVIAKGRLEELTHFDGAAWSSAERAGVEPWAGGDKPHVLCLHMDRLTGRRVGKLV